MKTIVAYGEIMGRISMPGFRRIGQCLPGSVDVEFAGAEANVLASLALFGARTSLVTALPRNEIAEACIASLRARNVGTANILRTDAGRLGLYFVEKGANQRAGTVVYDREGSAVSQTPGEDYDWPAILSDAGWLHLTGITPALSATASRATLLAARTAREHSIPVSCDLNFRGKLWRWDPALSPRDLATREMQALLPWVTHLVGGREDAAEMLGIRPTTPPRGDDAPDPDAVLDVARQIHTRFPQLEWIAMTQRETVSALHHRWGGFLYDTRAGRAHWAPVSGDGPYTPYSITHIVDRVGGGDAFSAGLLQCWTSEGFTDPARAVAFATAASCLAHSIEGDANLVTRAEVEALIAGSGSGRLRR